MFGPDEEQESAEAASVDATGKRNSLSGWYVEEGTTKEVPGEEESGAAKPALQKQGTLTDWYGGGDGGSETGDGDGEGPSEAFDMEGNDQKLGRRGTDTAPGIARILDTLEPMDEQSAEAVEAAATEATEATEAAKADGEATADPSAARRPSAEMR